MQFTGKSRSVEFHTPALYLIFHSIRLQWDVLASERLCCGRLSGKLKGIRAAQVGANNRRWNAALGGALALIMSSAACKAKRTLGCWKPRIGASGIAEEKGGAGAEAALKSNWAINYGAQPTKHARVGLPLALFLYTAIGIVSWNSLSHKGNKYIKRYPPPSGDARARSIRSSQVSRRRLQVGLPDIAKSSWKWPPDKKKTESISGRGRTREREPPSDSILSCWLTQHAAQTTIPCTLFLLHCDNLVLFNLVRQILIRISIKLDWIQQNKFLYSFQANNLNLMSWIKSEIIEWILLLLYLLNFYFSSQYSFIGTLTYQAYKHNIHNKFQSSPLVLNGVSANKVLIHVVNESDLIIPSLKIDATLTNTH